MSIRKKIDNKDIKAAFTQKIETTLFELLDDDDPLNHYMLTDICKQLNIDPAKHFPEAYCSGIYNLKKLSQGDYDKTLKVTEALYETCMRFHKFDMALIVNSLVTRCLIDADLKLNWVDGCFYISKA